MANAFAWLCLFGVPWTVHLLCTRPARRSNVDLNGEWRRQIERTRQ